MAASEAAGTELIITETYRSSERQQQLYDQKLTQLRTVGVHHYGLACDFAKMINGKASWDGDWTFCAELAKKVSTADRIVISGTDWGEPDQSHSFVDSDHIQGCTVAQQTELFAGTWYPNDASPTPAIAPVPATTTAAPPVAAPCGLTAAQSLALAAFDTINIKDFASWFKRSTFMAFCETESQFNPKAFRQEPSGVASYGLFASARCSTCSSGLGVGWRSRSNV